MGQSPSVDEISKLVYGPGGLVVLVNSVEIVNHLTIEQEYRTFIKVSLS